MDDQDKAAQANSAPQSAAAAPAPAANSALPSVPASWPGAFGLYKYSKKAVQLNVATIVIVWLIFAVISGSLDYTLKPFGSVASLIVGSLSSATLALTYIAGVRGGRLSVGEALSKGVSFWLKMIGLTILLALSIVGSLIALIIPFFFVFPRLVLANYFLVDQNMGVVDAYKASWAATKGHAGKIWGIIGATILMALLMITIIGIPFSIYFLIMYSGALAVLYEFLRKSQPAPAKPAASPAAPPAPTPTV